MGELDRVAQRKLQHADPELDLGRYRGERCQNLKRIECRPSAAQRIPDPDAGKAAGFGLPAIVRDAIHQPVSGTGADPYHRTYSHTSSLPEITRSGT